MGIQKFYEVIFFDQFIESNEVHIDELSQRAYKFQRLGRGIEKIRGV